MDSKTLHSGSERKLALLQAYLPVIRGYFAVVCIYYTAMTIIHISALEGRDMMMMVGASTSAVALTIFGWIKLKNQVSILTAEVLAFALSLLILANVIIALGIEYNQAKLFYFVMMAMIFAFASVSMRQSLLSISMAFGGLFYKLYEYAPDQIEIYGFVSFAAALSAVAIAYFLRRAMQVAINAANVAEYKLRETEILSDKMRRQSMSDSLTGLPNRRAFFAKFSEQREDPECNDQLWLIMLDLDGFKAVNDNYGHMIGDKMLKSVSERIRAHSDDTIHASRMGGDEFSIIICRQSDEAAVEEWCNELLLSLADAYVIEDRPIQVSGSIGCFRVDPEEKEQEAIRNADFALLGAKRAGKNRVVMFRAEHAEEAAERYRIEQALRIADFSKEIDLVFQPQYDLQAEAFTRAEVLARWNSPVIGSVPPMQFIKVAEECGFIAKITVAVLEKAIEHWQNSERPIGLSMNLSGNDILSDQIMNRIVELLQESNVPADAIEFEVTETAMMPDTEKASGNLLRLAEMGHSIALDDFGTGYSNFSYLRSLPIGKLKIDRSFIEDITDPMTEKVLQSLVGMARTIDVPCLLEGVENELELVAAKRAGVHAVQGYYFGMPMSAADLADFMADKNTVIEQPRKKSGDGLA